MILEPQRRPVDVRTGSTTTNTANIQVVTRAHKHTAEGRF